MAAKILEPRILDSVHTGTAAMPRLYDYYTAAWYSISSRCLDIIVKATPQWSAVIRYDDEENAPLSQPGWSCLNPLRIIDRELTLAVTETAET